MFYSRKSPGFGVRLTQVQVLAMPLVWLCDLGWLLYLSEPQASQQLSEDDKALA